MSAVKLVRSQGVTAPAGFRAAGIPAGIKASGALDLALVFNEGPDHHAAGGAQAIAMFAYGVGPCERVDMVTGPGNIYVATAKKAVFGRAAPGPRQAH